MKKILSATLVVMLILASTYMTFAGSQNIGSNLDDGIVTVQLTDITSAKILFLVEKDGIRYTYPIVDKDINQFPLQLGNGTYTVRVMQNIEGNKYKELSKATVELDLENSNDVFLNSIQDIEWNDNQAAILKAKELTKGLSTDQQKIDAIYQYITKNYKYDYAKAKTVTSGYFPNVETIFNKKTGICYDYSSLFAAMLRSVDIPTKLVKGHAIPTGSVYHAWNEVFVGGTWKVIDTTTDAAYIQMGKSISQYKTTAQYTAEKIY